MSTFIHKSSLIKKQRKWWKIPKLFFSPKYSLRIISFTACLIAIGSISYIWQWSNYLQIGYRIQALEVEKRKTLQRIDLLEIEASFLMRLERLEHIATTQMNMIQPTFPQRLIIPPLTDE